MSQWEERGFDGILHNILKYFRENQKFETKKNIFHLKEHFWFEQKVVLVKKLLTQLCNVVSTYMSH